MRLVPRLRGVAASIDTRRFRYPMTFRVEPIRAFGFSALPGEDPDACITMRVEVPDRDTGAALTLEQSITVTAAYADRPDLELARLFLRLMQDFAQHEAAECFFVNGERLFDPHQGTIA